MTGHKRRRIKDVVPQVKKENNLPHENGSRNTQVRVGPLASVAPRGSEPDNSQLRAQMDEEFNPTSHTNYCQKLLHSFCGVLIGALSTPC